MKKLNTEDFILKANIVHNFLYDYSSTYYNNSRSNVDIICRVHGVFSQKANSHLNGKGCNKCYQESLRLQNMSFEEFKEEAEKKYSGKFEYLNCESFSSESEITFICPHHGQIKQNYKNHLKIKHGCVYCAEEEKVAAKKLSVGDFVYRSNRVHKNKYGYNFVTDESFYGILSKIKIQCPVHGVFIQTASDHLHRKSGCPSCCQYGFRKNESGKLYVMQSENITKVGITNGDPAFRAKQISKSAEMKFEVVIHIHYENGHIADLVETDLLDYLCKLYKKPLSKFDGYTECFIDVDYSDLLKHIAAFSEKHLKFK